jgi:hypothetical protein
MSRETTLAEFFLNPAWLSADSAEAWNLKIIGKPTGFVGAAQLAWIHKWWILSGRACIDITETGRPMQRRIFRDTKYQYCRCAL